VIFFYINLYIYIKMFIDIKFLSQFKIIIVSLFDIYDEYVL